MDETVDTEWSDCSDSELLSACSEVEDDTNTSDGPQLNVFEEMKNWLSEPMIDLELFNRRRREPASLPESLMEWQQDWDSSDSETLEEKSRRYKTIKREGITFEDKLSDQANILFSDDQISSEESFKPTTEMINTSDSESNISLNLHNSDEISSGPEIFVPKTKKKKNRSKSSNCSNKSEKIQPHKSCRRKIKMSRKERNLSSKLVKRAKSTVGVNRVKQNSLRMEKMKQLIYKLHKRRLEIFLRSNGLIQVPIAADGNCFMEAVSIQLDGQISSNDLRQGICNHLSQNIQDYIHFFASASNFYEQNEAYYHSQVDYLRTEGHWASSLSDALPLAVANMYHRQIQIYSSQPNQPMINIQPSNGHINSDPIQLTLIAAPGQEHYDLCQEIYGSEADLCKTPKKQKTSNAEVPNGKSTKETNTPEKKPKKLIQDILQQLTPRKQAIFITPTKKTNTRKRQRNEKQWKRNVRKNLRQLGQEYLSVKGEKVPKRQMKKVDCSRCKFKCSQNISEPDRLVLFESYWNIGDDQRQREFICSHVLEKESGNRSGKQNKRKTVARNFTFHVNGESIRVCKRFFIGTLGITVKRVDYTLENARGKAVPVTPKTRRGKKSPSNKTPRAVISDIKNHIESFPTVDSHYTRKNTARKYLSSDLSITKMYELYTEHCKETASRTASFAVYRRIFCTQYNLSFHVPKKDQCDYCNKYKQMEKMGTVDIETELNYNLHQERKVNSRIEKDKDKKKAKSDNTFNTVTFDLEAVLPTPCSLVSQAYYKRKLSCYNFSVYSLADSKAYCFMWNETEGGRGSCEVGTCLNLYLNSLPSTVKHVCLYSDSCIGQNRNQYVAAALQHAVLMNPHLEIVEQKFLEKGHTHMECDSMHAAVEKAKKKTPVCVPSQWDTVVRMARRKNPYIVVPIKHWDIIDFKAIASVRLQNAKKTIKGEILDWRQVRQVRFMKTEPDFMYLKYDLCDDEFKVIKCKLTTRGRPELTINEPPRRYTERLPISSKKKKDLLDLCKSLVIPYDHHLYYNDIPCSTSINDKLPQPDEQEDDNDSEKE